MGHIVLQIIGEAGCTLTCSESYFELACRVSVGHAPPIPG